MSSRLDRLFILLESGGSLITRRAAAKQLGDVVKGQEADSDEVCALLERILPLLYSKSWDTRVAAASAVGAVLDNIPAWHPKPASQRGGGSTRSKATKSLCVDLKAGGVTITTVLQCGRPLSADQDVAVVKDEHKLDSPAEDGARLHRERHLLNQTLGLDAAESLGFDSSTIFSNDDLAPTTSSRTSTEQTSAAVLLSGMPSDPAKAITGKRTTLLQEGSPCKRLRLSSDQLEQKPPEEDSLDLSSDSKPLKVTTKVDTGEWPFAWLCADLLREMLSSCWETRHGAATALRELLARHGGEGGKKDYDTPQQLSEGHQRWVWAVSVRLVCVLALDTFGDYLADQVVAPVRETVAQALGVACVQLWAPHVCGVASLLGQLVAWRGGWTARHGGLLGLKYTLAARRDILPKLLRTAYDNIYAGLLDDTDDVVGVAAECLTVCCSSAPVKHATDLGPATSAGAGGDTNAPTKLKEETDDAAAEDGGDDLDTSMVMVIDEEEEAAGEEESGIDDVEDESGESKTDGSLLQWLSEEQLCQLLATVWRSLLHVDDLSASTPALLLLLASIVKLHPKQQGWSHDSLRELVPRLFPFLQHSSSCVRRSALTTLAALTDPTSPGVLAGTDLRRSSSTLATSAHVQTNERTDIKPMEGEPASPLSSKENVTTITTSTNDHPENCGASSGAHQTKITSSRRSLVDTKPLRTVQTDQSHNLKTTEIKSESILSSCETDDNKDTSSTSEANHGGNAAINSSVVSSSDEPDNLNITEAASRGLNDGCNKPVKSESAGTATAHPDFWANFRTWCEPILTSILRHLFQRALTESSSENLALIEQIWAQTLSHCSLTAVLMAACPLVAGWLSLAATPSTSPLDPALLLLLPPALVNKQNNEHLPSKASPDPLPPDRPLGCGAAEPAKQRSVQFVGGSQHSKKGTMIACRSCAARLLGELSLYVSRPMPDAVYRPGEDPLACYTVLLLTQLRSQSALQRTTAASVVRQWALCYSDSALPAISDSDESEKSDSKHLKTSLDASQSSARPAEKESMPSRRYLALAEDMPSCGVVRSRSTSDAGANSHTGRRPSDAGGPTDWAVTKGDAAPSGVVSSSCNPAMNELFSVLLSCLTQPVYYDEIAVSFTRLQQDTKDFLSSLKHYGVEVDNYLIAAPVLTLDQMSEAVHGQWLLQQLAGSKLRVKVRNTLETRRLTLVNSLRSTSATQELLTLSTRGVVAGALVRLGRLPSKLNPVVKPLIDSIKMEENKHLQSEAGQDLTALLELCSVREKSPNAKVLKNLAAFLCVDPRHTPILMQSNGDTSSHEDKYSGIYFLRILNEAGESQESYSSVPAAATTSSFESLPVPAKRKRGRPPSKPREQTEVAATLPCPILQHNTDHQELRKLAIQRRGCCTALQHLVQHFGHRLPTLLPALWDLICHPLLHQSSPGTLVSQGSVTRPTVVVNAKNVTAIGGGDVRHPSPDSAATTTTSSSSLATSSYSVASLLAPQSTKEVHNSNNSDSPTSLSSHNSVNEEHQKAPVAVGGCGSATSNGALVLPSAVSGTDEDTKAQELVNWLQLLDSVLPVLQPSLLEKVCQHLPSLEQGLYHRYCSVRHMAGRVLGTLATVHTEPVMGFLLERLLPALADITSVVRRQGAVECLHLLVERMGFNVLPYVVLLIVPLLGSSSDPDASVRAAGSQVFASLIKLLPLDGFMPDPPHLPPSITRQRDKHRDFLHQLMDGNKAHHYTIPVTINATLREYQQAGVNWLAFMRDYGVHGILCDDMGLGKTLQTLCILAGTHYEYDRSHEKDGCATKRRPCLQSLVICPPTLTGHWVYEVEHYVPAGLLRPLHYQGSPAERHKLRDQFSEHNLIVASYDIVRNEADFFADVQWLYIILDEGHVIKNTKTKSYQAIRRLSGHHRLILSGTPIQNNVLELWSLFDFLMPGYLGSERHFNNKYSRPILSSRDVKASRADQEAGVVAMEALHRQALPFMMRRLKEDVLKELPPKISQDYYCELSSLQKMLYEDFLESQGSSLDDEQTPKAHVFQALQYLRLVCNHPALVLRPQHPRFNALLTRAGITRDQLHNISFAAKLPALRELLLECGIGGGTSAGSGGGETLVAPHRALVFCQFRTMIDIIEKDLLTVHMPSVTYVRLDGSVPSGQRYGLVQRFNQDPSIDLMLVTTQVGGLGLSLTAADTVIFVEHDWNPMKDLQAMDRAHRIGQKRVVNVYRLITRHTIEEKIMGLQKFKLMTANTVISPENASMNSMGTEQILDLFSLENDKSGKKAKSGEVSGGETGGAAPRAVLDGLPDLWDQAQYHDEYDLDKFIASFGR